MHDTFLEGVKFHLDHFDRYEDTCFLAGWVYSEHKPVASLRVESLNHFSEEIHQFEIRHDVNKFYDLTEETPSGFKFVLSPEKEFPSLLFSVRFEGEDNYKVIKDVNNPRQNNNQQQEAKKPEIPQISIGNPFTI